MSASSAPAPPLRIAAVPEAFNDPFALASFPSPTEFVPEPGGSGAMLALLTSGAVDAAFLLTECAVAAAARGTPVRLLGHVVASPLVWGAVVRADAAPADGLRSARWATSRAGSGSDVMLRVLAARSGWARPAAEPLGGFGAMAAAVLAGQADAFLWEVHTTRGLLRKGLGPGLALRPGVDAPWPAFSVAVRADCKRVARVRAAADAFLHAAIRFQKDEGTPAGVAGRHGMAPDDAAAWVRGVRYAQPGSPCEEGALRAALKALIDAQVVDSGTEFRIGDYTFE